LYIVFGFWGRNNTYVSSTAERELLIESNTYTIKISMLVAINKHSCKVASSKKYILERNMYENWNGTYLWTD